MNTQKVISISVTSYGGRDKKWFDYLAENDQKCLVGSLVIVDFKSRQTLGIVRQVYVSSSLNNPTGYTLKPIYKILDYPPLPGHLLNLADWLIDYYNSSQKAVWSTILPAGLKAIPRRKTSTHLERTGSASKIELNIQQKSVIERISTSDSRGFLLNGVTGSGKTEVYINLLTKTLASNKSAIVLVPEIALTPQMSQRLVSHFTNRILLTHSHMSAATRKRIWLEALGAKKPKIIVGPRSALFTPLDNIGLIIIDEEHETSYKQESSPRYHATTVVAQISRQTGAKYILGSATPSIFSSWLADQGKIERVWLKKRALGQKLPTVSVVDLKNRHELLTPELITTIDDTLSAGRQVLLFLNQRGSAQAYMCETCGQAIRCPNCETSLTMHGDLARLLCHYCNFRMTVPATCPHCNGKNMFFIGSGTKQIEAQIRDRYATAQIARLDRDNATFEHLEDTYNKLRDGQIDIIIGTQMIARGLDIAGIDLVGVILADSMLNIPDFSASERTFTLLTQVAGRAGRTDRPGRVIIQTYSPEHPAIIAASQHDEASFYEYELPHRRKFHYPPFCYLAKLTYNNISDSKALAEAERTASQLKGQSGITVLGPAPAYIRKSTGRYRWQLILKSYSRPKLVEATKKLKDGWTVDLDPINLL